MGQNNANLIEDTVYTLVLRKLKHILVNGFYSMDEVRYEYFWDEKAPKAENIHTVRKEDAVLRYFIDMKVIIGQRIPNEFREQQLRGNEADKNFGVWADWDNVDSAYREYEWVVLIHGIDTEKFESQLDKFSLEDTGLELVGLKNKASASPAISKFGYFTAREDGSIFYKNNSVELKPEVKRLVYALVVKEGKVLPYEQIVDVLWNEENNTQSYLEDPSRTRRDITKRISNIVSEANSALYPYGNKKHLVASGETSYKLII